MKGLTAAVMDNWKGAFGMEREGLLKDCALCPRACHVDRTAGRKGYCAQGDRVVAARAALHFWEEPCISGESGSGAVFFSGCSLRCVFCQNGEIAAGRAGKEISKERLTDIFLELQEKGANNINLVTAGHFAPLVADALEAAKNRGLSIPAVYNTSSYENVGTLRMLDGLIDVYLPDFKYVSARLAQDLSRAPDYFERAASALEEMVRQVGDPLFASASAAEKSAVLTAREMNDACLEDGDSDFLMKRGVIVRHLALPGQGEDSRRALRFLHETWGERIYISLMNQYTPMPGIWDRLERALGDRAKDYRDLCRKLTEREYDRLVDYLVDLGAENAFIQEGKTAEESFIPAFDGEGI